MNKELAKRNEFLKRELSVEQVKVKALQDQVRLFEEKVNMLTELLPPIDTEVSQISTYSNS